MTQAWPSGKKGIRGKGRVSEGDFKWKMRGSNFFFFFRTVEEERDDGVRGRIGGEGGPVSDRLWLIGVSVCVWRSRGPSFEFARGLWLVFTDALTSHQFFPKAEKGIKGVLMSGVLCLRCRGRV